MHKVEELVRQGRIIEAIKEYRTLTGVSLREAKDTVMSLQDKQQSEQYSTHENHTQRVENRPDEFIYREVYHLAVNQKQLVRAIKVYRDKTGVSLQEAKNFVDNLVKKENNSGPEKQSPKSNKKWLIFVLTAAVVLIIYYLNR